MKPPAPVTQTVWPWPETEELSAGILILSLVFGNDFLFCSFGWWDWKRSNRDRESLKFVFCDGIAASAAL